jgi:hypothetical protein
MIPARFVPHVRDMVNSVRYLDSTQYATGKPTHFVTYQMNYRILIGFIPVEKE